MKKRIQCGSKEIMINVNPGFYMLGSDSGLGKSYLYKLLKSYRKIPSHKDEILLFTYEDDITEEVVINKINKFDGELILLDRMDLYISKNIVEAIYSKVSNTVVLADIKDTNILNKINIDCVYSERTSDRIEVCNFGLSI